MVAGARKLFISGWTACMATFCICMAHAVARITYLGNIHQTAKASSMTAYRRSRPDGFEELIQILAMQLKSYALLGDSLCIFV